MSYATLMVHLDHEQPNEAKLEVAGQIAELFEANAIGIAACELNQSAYFTAGSHALELIEESRQNMNRQFAALETQFRVTMKGRAKEVEWRAIVDFPTRYVTVHTRAADLIIVGSIDGSSTDSWMRLDLGQLLLESGRPVLVVPPQQAWLDLRNVLVAWKDTREARRAIRDALPMLCKAKNVTVAEIYGDDRETASVQSRLADVAVWLERHGVRADTVATRSDGDAADRIDRLASENGAALIVAGAYGRARLREWAFGGVTRSLLAQERRFVLMSH